MHAGPAIRLHAESAGTLAQMMRDVDPPADDDLASWGTRQKERRWLCRFLHSLPEREMFPVEVYHDDAPDFIVIPHANGQRIGIEVTELVSENRRAVQQMERKRGHAFERHRAGDIDDLDLPADRQWGMHLDEILVKKTRGLGWSTAVDDSWLLIVDSWHRTHLISQAELEAELEAFRVRYWAEYGNLFHRVYIDVSPGSTSERILCDVRRDFVAQYDARDPWPGA